MPLQNRVDPFGNIHAVAARGMFTGNRGIIHDPATRTLLKKRWTTKAWIICVCEYKDRTPRDVMGYNRPRLSQGDQPQAGWTELFFLDEVSALAAGHRPCFTCRREKAKEFADCFGKAFGIAEPKAPEMDARLHRERLASGGKPPTFRSDEIANLPDGCMVAIDGRPHALRGRTLLPWSFEGYGKPVAIPDGPIQVLTPATTVAVLRAGYRSIWHASA